MHVDLLNQTPGRLQIVGGHQFPFHDREGHLRAWGEVKVLDRRQGDRRTGFVFQSLELHQFHGRDGLGRGERETKPVSAEEQMYQMQPGSWRLTGSGPRKGHSRSLKTPASSRQGNMFEHLKSTDDELQKCRAPFATELLFFHT